MMLAIPVQVGPAQFDVMLVLGKQNIERLQDYDPPSVDLTEFPPPWDKMYVRTIHICYATEEECLSFRGKSPADIWKVLSRNWAFRPELGDHELPPEPLEDFIKRRN